MPPSKIRDPKCLKMNTAIKKGAMTSGGRDCTPTRSELPLILKHGKPCKEKRFIAGNIIYKWPTFHRHVDISLGEIFRQHGAAEVRELLFPTDDPSEEIHHPE